jgi:ankyrin repeat protein
MMQPDRLPMIDIMIEAMKKNNYSLTHIIGNTNPMIGVNPECGTALHFAASAGVLSNVRRLVEAGHPIDIQLSHWDTRLPLHWATVAGHLDVVKYFIEECQPRVSVDWPDRMGRTPLQISMELGSYELVDYFLSHGASLDKQPKKGLGGVSLLHLAARSTSLTPLIPRLIAHLGPSSNVDLVMTNGNTPLHEASLRGNLDGVKLLVECKARVLARNKRGETVMHLAAERNHRHILQYIFDHPATHVDINGETVPFDNILDPLDQPAPSSTTTFAIGSTPLWCASTNGSIDAVHLLIDQKANVNAAVSPFLTCTMSAAKNGHTNVLRALADGGADLKQGDFDLISAMGHAAKTIQMDAVICLILLGAPMYVWQHSFLLNTAQRPPYHPCLLQYDLRVSIVTHPWTVN